MQTYKQTIKLKTTQFMHDDQQYMAVINSRMSKYV